MITLTDKIQTARKPHNCNWCNLSIAKGVAYRYTTNIYEGEFYQWKTHIRCLEIARHLKMFDDIDNNGLSSDDFWDFINQSYVNLLNEGRISESPAGNPRTKEERLQVVCIAQLPAF